MAIIDAIFTPSDGDMASLKITALGTSTSSAAVVLGVNRTFSISATGAYHIKFGLSGIGASDVGDFYVPDGQIFTFNTGRVASHIRIFNPSAAATINVHFQEYLPT